MGGADATERDEQGTGRNPAREIGLSGHDATPGRGAAGAPAGADDNAGRSDWIVPAAGMLQRDRRPPPPNRHGRPTRYYTRMGSLSFGTRARSRSQRVSS